MKIVLASSSPRRRDICLKYGMDPIIDIPNIVEIERDYEGPKELTMALSLEKAIDVSKRYKSGEIIISSDTVVYFQGEILGKPKSEREAFERLKKLSGNTHSVITGLAIVKAGTNLKIIDYVETLVKFKELSDDKIQRYIDLGEYKDKAGGYGIQGYGQLLVEEIHGSYLNVVGLPIEKLDSLLNNYFNYNIM